jgi:hypothetical protein
MIVARTGQPGHENVPHHPSGAGEDEQSIGWAEIEVRGVHFKVLEQNPTVRVDDSLGQTGRAETYVKVAGRWIYLYRPVDQHGQVIDVVLSRRRDARPHGRCSPVHCGAGRLRWRW